MATALGVEPMGVPIPPMFAANGMPEPAPSYPSHHSGTVGDRSHDRDHQRCGCRVAHEHRENRRNDHHPKHDKFWGFTKRSQKYPSEIDIQVILCRGHRQKEAPQKKHNDRRGKYCEYVLVGK